MFIAALSIIRVKKKERKQLKSQTQNHRLLPKLIRIYPYNTTESLEIYTHTHMRKDDYNWQVK